MEKTFNKISANISKDLNLKLKAFSEKTSKTKSAILRLALIKFINENKI